MEDSQPPVPPAVSAQQGGSQGQPPLQQFAQGAAGQGGPSSDQLMGQYIDQIGQTMTKLAQITVQTKPELTPILKQAIQALAMFAGKVKTAPQGQGGGQGGAQAGVPDGGSQGTAGTGQPDAGGGAALGMPQ